MSTHLHIGNIDLSFHAASAAVIRRLAERHGMAVESSAAPHEEAFRRLGAGEIDVLVAAWLPASHQKYLDPIADAVSKVTVLYQPYCIWAVPEYVPEEAVSCIDDLMKDKVSLQMDHLIQGINPGAGISRFSAAIVDQYGLGAAGYQFHTGSEEECFSRVRQGIADKEWFVVPLWHPQFLHHTYKLRALDEPRGLLGGQDQATLLVRDEALPHLPDGLLELWQGLHLGNASVSELDHRISVDGIEAQVAADAWLNANSYPESS